LQTVESNNISTTAIYRLLIALPVHPLSLPHGERGSFKKEETLMDTDTPHASDILSTLSNQMADAVEKINPALVQVNGRRRLPASGIVYEQGMVLTASHVLEREEDLTIQTHDGHTHTAHFVARDRASDIAVLSVADLEVGPAAAAATAARVGQFLLAVGRPSIPGPMASVGIVSAVSGPLRTKRGPVLEQYIQTDAVPFPGFSGGPMIDSQGAIIAMTTSGLIRGAAIGIPAPVAWRIGKTLAEQGHIKRGYLGIASQPVDLPAAQRGDLSQTCGLLVVRVEPNSPAEKGGLMVGDILVSLNGQPVTDTDDLQAMLRGDVVGNAVEMVVLRGETQHSVHVTVGERK
jgi:S1-C subfamily serine protease